MLSRRLPYELDFFCKMLRDFNGELIKMPQNSTNEIHYWYYPAEGAALNHVSPGYIAISLFSIGYVIYFTLGRRYNCIFSTGLLQVA